MSDRKRVSTIEEVRAEYRAKLAAAKEVRDRAHLEMVQLQDRLAALPKPEKKYSFLQCFHRQAQLTLAESEYERLVALARIEAGEEGPDDE